MGIAEETRHDNRVHLFGLFASLNCSRTNLWRETAILFMRRNIRSGDTNWMSLFHKPVQEEPGQFVVSAGWRTGVIVQLGGKGDCRVGELLFLLG